MQATAIDAPPTALATTEQQALDRCEAIIARGVQTFIEVGEALAEIREARLYRTGHGTFEEYCRERWGIGGSRARQLIGAAGVARHIESVTTVTLSNEAQARPMVGLAPDQQVAAYQAAAVNGAPTAKAIAAEVDAIAQRTPRDLAAAGVELRRHGVWFKAIGRDAMNGWSSIDALPFEQAVALARAEIARRAGWSAPITPESRDADGPWFKASKSDAHPTAHHWNIRPTSQGHYTAACGIVSTTLPTTGADSGLCSVCAKHGDRRELVPIPSSDDAPPAALGLIDLGDILIRLDAHGYAKTTTRQKGITTFYSFRDYRSTLDDDQPGELELAEGELPLWLAELDSHAAYAQAKQERYLEYKDRAERLGYDLRRDGAQFVLTPAGQKVPALVGNLDTLIKTIEGYEKNAAKKATAAPAQTPTLAELDQIGMPVDLHNAGYYWHSATPPTIALNNSDRRWDGVTVELAIDSARTHKDSKGEPITVFPALTPLECKALMREARQFIASGLDRKLPTIGQALRIAARMALEATE